MTTPVVTQIGGLSQVGLTTESTFGTFAAPTSLLPATECTIDPDPGLFYIAPMVGYRDSQWFPMYGQYKFAGALGGALFPTNGSPLFGASIASDNQAGYGITGTSPTSSTTLNGATLAGATSVVVTSATGYAVNDIIQVDVNNTSTPTTAECRKITSVSGTTLNLDKALTFAHASGQAVSVVTSPFAHTMNPAATLGSMSVSKRVGNTQAEQWAGCRVSKWGLKAQATNTAVEYTADIIAQSVTVNDAPSNVAITNETPFEWVNLSLEYNSLTVTQANNLNFTLDNKLVEDYTFAQQHNVQFITPSGLMVNGSFDVVYNSLDDADWGYFSQILQQATAQMVLTFAAPAGVELKLTMPQVSLKTYKDSIKSGEPIRTTINWDASASLTSTPVGTLEATLANTQYLPL